MWGNFKIAVVSLLNHIACIPRNKAHVDINLPGAIACDIAVHWNDGGLWRGVDGLVAGRVLRVPHVGDGVLGLDEGVPVQGSLVFVRVS